MDPHFSSPDFLFDVIVIGGGPAGLSAALVLGRARRRVLVCDSGQYRNASSHGMHGFLTRDGMPPSEFRKIAHEEISKYPSVKVLFCKVEDVQKSSANAGTFIVNLSDGSFRTGRKIILATGIVDELPPVEGVREVYGQGLFHCPYCDGWEVQEQSLCVYGRGDAKGAGMALEMLQWSSDVLLCTDGPSELSEAMKEKLRSFQIPVDERRIKRLSKAGAALDAGVIVTFEMGPEVKCRAMFFNTGTRLANNFAERLGCELIEEDGKRSEYVAGKTCVHGVYIAGDASRDVLQVIVAAGEGSAAAIALNAELLRDDGIL